MQWLLALLCLVTLATTQGQTVNSAISSRGCSTSVVAGLSKQLVQQTNLLKPNLFTDISNIKGLSLTPAVRAVPYLQTPAANGLSRVVQKSGRTMTINSALRTLPQQLLLRKWFEMRACKITAAALPGQSNHNGGLAVDIDNSGSWVSAMSAGSFRHLGPSDPPHFDYIGSGRVDVRSLSVKAFQILWNRNAKSASARLPENGVYNAATEKALLQAPVNGFPIGPGGSSGGVTSSTPSRPASSPTGPSCTTSSGIRGTCINTNVQTCSGQLFRGLCPGASNIRCCTGSVRAVAESQSTFSDAEEQSPAVSAGFVVIVASVVVASLVAIVVVIAVVIAYRRQVQAENTP